MDVTPEQRLELERLKKEMLRKILDKGALERLGRVRMANPMLAEQVELYFMQLYQQGQIKGAVTEEKLKGVLNLLVKKRDTRITVRSK